jgi:hypothetical protein
MTRWFQVAIAGLVLLFAHHNALGQSRVPLSQLVPNLVTQGAVLSIPQPNDPRGPGAPPRPGDLNTNNFVNALPLNPAPGAYNATIGLQVAGFPTVVVWAGVPRESLAAAAADASPALFGSAFAERATTLGQGAFALGFSRQGTTFGEVDGFDLQDGVNMYFEYADCCPGGSPLNPELERDLLRERLSVDVHRDVFGFVANYGVTGRFDVGALVPIVKVNLEARVHSQILRLATAADPMINRFDWLEIANKTLYTQGAAQGLGDIQLHGKLRLFDAAGGGLALVGGARLPTGDEEEWLGTGEVQGRLGAVWSGDFGRFAPHASGSYARSAGGGGRPPDEIAAMVGTDVAIVSRFGLSAEVMYRNLLDVDRARQEATVFPFRGPGASPPSFTAGDNVVVNEGNLQQVLGIVSGKVLLGRRVLAHSDLMLTILDDGLAPQFSFVAGLSYTF